LQQPGHDQHDARFLVIEPLGDREQRAQQEQRACRAHAADEPLGKGGRHQQEAGSDKAGRQMRGFDERQGQQQDEVVHPCVLGRQGARQQQDEAACKTHRAEQGRADFRTTLRTGVMRRRSRERVRPPRSLR
jgi:hypothetical protein